MSATVTPWPAALAGTPTVAVIERAIERLRLAHSLLLHGENLSTLASVAHAIADRLLNDPRAKSQYFPPKQHPDFLALRPAGKSRQIGAEATREAIGRIQVSPQVSHRKVLVVYEADRMNISAANIFLKTLEEPTASTTILLLSTRPYSLLPTIRSRCLGHTLTWPQPGEAVAWLQEQGVPAAAATGLLKAAGGRPEDAQRLHAAGLDARTWSQWPKSLVRGDMLALANWGPAELVEAFQKLCHDLLARHSGAEPRFFDANDLPAAASVPALTAWWRSLAATSRTVDHPFNAGLMLEDLVAQARTALHSK